MRKFLLLAFLLTSCGHLSTPDYETPTYVETSKPSDFTPPEEIYKSKDLQAPHTQPIFNKPFSLQWPVKKIAITRGFLKAGHLGLDIRGRRNDFIFAAHDGVIIYAGSGFRGYGKMVILEFNHTWATLYGHMNKLKVKTGQVVHAGQLIGLMGRTGRATGVHLHFELIENKQPIDPSGYFLLTTSR